MDLNSDGWKQRVLLALEAARDWTIQNRKISVPVAVVVLIGLLVGVSLLHTQKGTEEETAESVSVPDVPLEENAVAAVNELMNSYYAALEDADIEKLEKLINYISDVDKLGIQKKSNYIDRYNNITCYTKKGQAEDSYIVYAYQEVKFYDYETPVPSLNTFVVYKNEDGSYYIYEGDLDDNVLQYFNGLSAQDDVANLCTTVQAKYNKAIAGDEALDEFISGFNDRISEEVAQSLAESEQQEAAAQAEGDGSEAETETETQEQPPEPVEETPQEARVTEVETIDTVNVRSSDSEMADKVGKAEKGMRLPLVEKKENGWSKIQFEGKEAFIKSEYLADIVNTSQETASNTPSENQETEKPKETEQENTSSGGGGFVGTDGKVTAKTTVNVRSSANESGERLGVIYAGEQLELVMQQADGWCKVKYDGKTGYVKTEFVE
ncbi:MAG: SH3 domain-containing protein [Lachnospiraceae bacterium]|jgi:uncharacterized protein YgiM (DUF1202 family)|nr:SH3 domain-containing protein [Lachnospiraceae bacterium]